MNRLPVNLIGAGASVRRRLPDTTMAAPFRYTGSKGGLRTGALVLVSCGDAAMEEESKNICDPFDLLGVSRRFELRACEFCRAGTARPGFSKKKNAAGNTRPTKRSQAPSEAKALPRFAVTDQRDKRTSGAPLRRAAGLSEMNRSR
jgi:hypothetical protein